MKGRPISHYAPYSDVGKAYKRITKEILAYSFFYDSSIRALVNIYIRSKG